MCALNNMEIAHPLLSSLASMAIKYWALLSSNSYLRIVAIRRTLALLPSIL